MARLLRVCPEGIPQHVIQRGNDRRPCFVEDKDFAVYARWLHDAAQTHGVAVHAWVFMTNHVHLLVTPQFPNAVSRMMQTLGRRYVRYFNATHQRTGTLWEGRFKSCLIDAESYLLACQRYIELNPVRAGMVRDPADYRWSSYRASVLGVAAKLWTPHEAYLALGTTDGARRSAYKYLVHSQLTEGMIGEIRAAVNTGEALGGEGFKKRIEELTGRRVTRTKPGRKPGRKDSNSVRVAGGDEMLL